MAALTAGPGTAERAAERAAEPTGVQTAEPMAVPAAVGSGPPRTRGSSSEHAPDPAGPGGAGTPPGSAPVHEPGSRDLRGRVLVPAAAAHPGRRHRRVLRRPAR